MQPWQLTYTQRAVSLTNPAAPAHLRSSSALEEAQADAEYDEAYQATYAAWAPVAAQDRRLLFVLADAEDAEEFDDDSKEFWAVQVGCTSSL